MRCHLRKGSARTVGKCIAWITWLPLAVPLFPSSRVSEFPKIHENSESVVPMRVDFAGHTVVHRSAQWQTDCVFGSHVQSSSSW